jgi:hypothetical protein
MSNSENVTIHFRVKDYATWRAVTMGTRRTASPRVSRMGECSAGPKTLTMSDPSGCRRRDKGPDLVGIR